MKLSGSRYQTIDVGIPLNGPTTRLAIQPLQKPPGGRPPRRGRCSGRLAAGDGEVSAHARGDRTGEEFRVDDRHANYRQAASGPDPTLRVQRWVRGQVLPVRRGLPRTSSAGLRGPLA